MSPTFILSFSAGIVSTFVMGFFYFCHSLLRPEGLFQNDLRLSIVGISVLGALAHNLTQLYLAYLILVKHPGIFVFLPWLCIGAVVMGWLTGVLSGQVCLKIRQIRESGVKEELLMSNRSPLTVNHYLPGESIIHSLPAETKIAAIFVLSLLALIFNNFWSYIGLSLCVLVLAIIARIPFNILFLRVKKYSFLVLVSFLFPLFFNSGLNTGVFIAWRVLFLILLSSLLVMVTLPRDLGAGMAKLLLPLKPLGISRQRTAAIISLSWTAVPVFWEMTRKFIRNIDFKKVKAPSEIIPLFSDFIAKLYLQAEQKCC